jgi:hypothetical protein
MVTVHSFLSVYWRATQSMVAIVHWSQTASAWFACRDTAFLAPGLDAARFGASCVLSDVGIGVFEKTWYWDIQRVLHWEYNIYIYIHISTLVGVFNPSEKY